MKKGKYGVMSGYVVRYAVWAPLLFALVCSEGGSPLYFIGELQTELTAYLTERGIALFAMPIRMEGDTLVFEHGMKLFVGHECSGLAPIVLFGAAVLAFPTTPRSRAVWLFIGYVVLTALNLVRILGVAYGVSLDPGSFGWAHDIAGRYGMGILTLALFWLFTLSAEVDRHCANRTVTRQDASGRRPPMTLNT